MTQDDDYPDNILDRRVLNQLYRVLDLCLVTSRRRTEGGPHAILEAAASRCKIMSTRVGQAPDVLRPDCVVDHPIQFLDPISKDIADNWLETTLDPHEEAVHRAHTVEAIGPPLQEAYGRLKAVAAFRPRPLRPNQVRKRRDSLWSRRVRKVLSAFVRRRGPHTVSLWHKFFQPPYGGGNQFLLALERCLRSRHGMDVRRNEIHRGIDAYLLNAVQFDIRKFERRRLARLRLAVLHRIDGPIHLYRGTQTRDLDEKTYRLNRTYAGATVIQS
ncbi:MAG: glycosyltransferase family 4 protein, partial [Acidobacteria bacterium]|nr:glycosyltransferase family 4 protein [Acidobacteriota bacterium]